MSIKWSPYPQPAIPHLLHQSSLQGVSDFAERPSLTEAQHISATRRFYQLVNHFGETPSFEYYDRVKLVRYTYEFARTRKSKGIFLRALFDLAGIPIDSDQDLNLADAEQESHYEECFSRFAEYLLDNFFMPLKASSGRTPQPSPATHSAIQRAQGEGRPFLGTPDRVSDLRGKCLLRDRHRCAITRSFDMAEGVKRSAAARRRGDVARDDDGEPISEGPVDFLEVAHILPHSLTQLNASGQLDSSKSATLAILNMFDCGVASLIDGTEIDQPKNAISLTPTMHRLFGEFRVSFEPVEQPNQPHTYRTKSFLDPALRNNQIPPTRTLFLTPKEPCTIDPPSPRLLAIHHAIANILHLSAAGEYIDEILRDLEEVGVRADGSSELGRFLKLRLGGWPVGVAG